MRRDVGPRFSHDGKRIAFLRVESGRVTLNVAERELSVVRAVADAGQANPDVDLRTGAGLWTGREGPYWLPYDDGIAYPRCRWVKLPDGHRLPGTEIWKYDLSSGQSAPLIELMQARDEPDSPLAYYVRTPSFRQDGQYFTAVAEAAYGRRWLVLRPLIAIGLATAQRLPDQYRDSDWPMWSPDGRLAYAQGILRDMTADRVAVLRIMEPGGTYSCRRLTVTAASYRELCPRDVDQHPESPVDVHLTHIAWSRDSSKLLFCLTPDALDRQRYSVWSLPASGTEPPKRLSPDDGAGYTAPMAFADGTVGMIRVLGRAMQAIVLTSDGVTTHAINVPSDDLDWSPDGTEFVVALPGVAGDTGMHLRVQRLQSSAP
jgi:hypothetical protein